MKFLTRTALCAALFAPVAWAWSDVEAYDAFTAAGYGDCDAFVLGKLWIVSMSDAKVRGGTLILDGKPDELVRALGEAEQIYSCASPGAIEPADGDLIAELWGRVW